MRRVEGRRHAGFTLLEVLAAIAIVAITFTLFASVSIQSMRAEGINHRLVLASLLADRTLSEIELQLATGTFPEVGVTESEDFLSEEPEIPATVVVEVSPFDTFAETQIVPAYPPDRRRLEPGAPTDTLALLGAEVPELTEMLATVRVRVSWLEGADEMEVVRSTFVLDRASAMAAYSEGLGGADGAGNADDGDGADSPSLDDLQESGR